MRPTIITLSTIPPRFAKIGATLDSLLRQRLPAQEIRLYIPETYRRFPDWDGVPPALPEGIGLHRCKTDLGPATKLLPATRDLAGQDLDILVCDDDKIYDPDWHARFKSASGQHPDCCIVEIGETFPDIADDHRPASRLPRAHRARKTLGYRMLRLLTLTMRKPRLYNKSGYVDQISGYGGVMVRPEWFDADAFDIPDNIWMVDDPWISGQLERKGIPIWLNGDGKTPGFGAAGRTHALLDLVEGGDNRVKSDLAAIAYLRERYGIWQKGGAVDTDFTRMTASMRALANARLSELRQGG